MDQASYYTWRTITEPLGFLSRIQSLAIALVLRSGTGAHDLVRTSLSHGFVISPWRDDIQSSGGSSCDQILALN